MFITVAGTVITACNGIGANLFKAERSSGPRECIANAMQGTGISILLDFITESESAINIQFLQLKSLLYSLIDLL